MNIYIEISIKSDRYVDTKVSLKLHWQGNTCYTKIILHTYPSNYQVLSSSQSLAHELLLRKTNPLLFSLCEEICDCGYVCPV